MSGCIAVMFDDSDLSCETCSCLYGVYCQPKKAAVKLVTLKPSRPVLCTCKVWAGERMPQQIKWWSLLVVFGRLIRTVYHISNLAAARLANLLCFQSIPPNIMCAAAQRKNEAYSINSKCWGLDQMPIITSLLQYSNTSLDESHPSGLAVPR